MGSRVVTTTATPGPWCFITNESTGRLTVRSQQSQQRRPYLPVHPIWVDTCSPLRGKTILEAPYPDGRYVLRDIGRRNYHGRRDVRVYVAGLHTTQMGPLSVKRRTELLWMAKLSRVDWRFTTEPGRSPSKTESSTPRDQELNDSSRNKAKRIRIVLNTTQHRVNAKTCGNATVRPTRLSVGEASRRRRRVLHKADHPGLCQLKTAPRTCSTALCLGRSTAGFGTYCCQHCADCIYITKERGYLIL